MQLCGFVPHQIALVLKAATSRKKNTERYELRATSPLGPVFALHFDAAAAAFFGGTHHMHTQIRPRLQYPIRVMPCNAVC